MSRASAAKAARVTWCFPETKSSSKATCFLVRAKAAEKPPGRVLDEQIFLRAVCVRNPVLSRQVRYEGVNGPSSVAVRGPSSTRGGHGLVKYRRPQPLIQISLTFKLQ